MKQQLKSTTTSLCVVTALAFAAFMNTAAHATAIQKIEKGTATPKGIQLLAQANPVSTRKIYVVEQSLPDFLRQAARRNGYEITMSSRVRGNLKNKSLPTDIKGILTQLAPQFDLKWHFQQKQVYVSVGSENTTRMIFLGKTKMSDLESALEGAGLSSPSYQLNYVEDSNSVIINGPASYIASVELLAESLGKNKKAKRDSLKVIRFGTVKNN
jgi:type II secretory pathway component GspD/PulD (secretin)